MYARGIYMSEQQFTDKQRLDNIYKILNYLSLMNNKEVHMVEAITSACAEKYKATIHPLQLVSV